MFLIIGCRNCGEEGYFVRECLEFRKGGGGGGDRGCRNCGEEGYFVRECFNFKKEGNVFSFFCYFW